MPATTFNPLKAAADLEAAGADHALACAIAEGMRQAAIADRDNLATKADIDAVRAAVSALRVEIRIIGAFVLAISAKLFGLFDAFATVL